MNLRRLKNTYKKLRRHHYEKRNVMLGGALVGLACLILVVSLYKTQAGVSSITPAPSPDSPAAAVPDPSAIKVQWLPNPRELTDLQLFSLESPPAGPKTTYYQVGRTSDDAQVILAVMSGPQVVPPQLFVAEKDGTYSYLVRHNNLNTASNSYVTGILLNRLVNLNTTAFIEDIVYKPTLAYGAATLETGKSYDYTVGAINFRSDYARPAIRDAAGTLYEVTNKVGKGYNVISYFMVGPDFRARTYRVRLPLDYVSGVLQATWKNGQPNTDVYERAFLPCDLTAGDAVATVTDFDLEETGTLANGDKVFILKAPGDGLQKTLYQAYLDYQKSIKADAANNLTEEQFRVSRAGIIVKDKINRYDILWNPSLLGDSGC